MQVSGAIAFLFLVIGVGVWYGARRPEVTLNQVTVNGGTTVPHELIESRARSVLHGSYALLIPRTFSYIFPHDEIVDAINAIPKVHNAAVVRSSRNELSVTFEEYVPYALWCNEVVGVGNEQPVCVFVDSNGYAYGEAPPLLGESLVRFVIEGRVPETRVFVYDTERLKKYQMLSEAINSEYGHRLRAITETKDGDLVLHLNNNVNVMMTRDADIDEVFSHIESVFSSESFSGVPFESLEYIDLRFGNKVYVKKRGAGDEESGATGSASSTDSGENH